MEFNKTVFVTAACVLSAVAITMYVSSLQRKELIGVDDGVAKEESKPTKEPMAQEIVKGLTYTVDREGDASVVAKKGNLVSVHYTGWLQNADGSKGKQFDSSRTRGEPFQFSLGGGMVIKGWDLGVEGMKKGETRTLTIASEYGYGPRGYPGAIPGGATLIFEVEFLG